MCFGIGISLKVLFIIQMTVEKEEELLLCTKKYLKSFKRHSRNGNARNDVI